MSTPSEEQNGCLPIIMILLGAMLIGFGWYTNGPSTPMQIESLIKGLANPATPTTLVIVVPNGDYAATRAPVAPAVAPVAPVAPVAAPVWVSNPINNEDFSAEAQSSHTAALPTATYAPVITMTATLIPNSTKVQIDTFPTAAAGPIMVVTATKVQEGETTQNQKQNISGHCQEWTNGECVINPTATPAPTYVPPTALPTTVAEGLPPTLTPLPPTPTITPTPLPENNNIKSLVIRQGTTTHGGTEVLATKNGVVVAHATTSDNGEFSLSGLDKGSYQLAAYSPSGSHLPACKEITIGGNQSIVVAQTMLSNGGGFNTDEKMNIGAAALVAIQLGLTIPEHMRPILDVSRDGTVSSADAEMLIANPKLLACQQW